MTKRRDPHLLLGPLILLLLLAELSACQTSNREMAGTGLGALVGGATGRLIGKNNTGLAVGALAGAFIGNRIGAYLDAAERQALEQATEHAATLPVNQMVVVNVPPSDSRRSRQPTRVSARPVGPPERTASGQTCRPIEQEVIKEGRTTTDQVMVCQAASNWTGG